MSDETPQRPLGGLVDELLSMLRASDTFKLVTTEGASHLANRAAARRVFIDRRLRPFKAQISDASEQHDFDAILKLAETEVDAQEKLADWLKGLAAGAG